ncbi:MAG: ABC transporter ATP-binding protein, partial [Chloroflexi bacterium]|nr:ABC transporter ATP-binding protein [Chloroflexota bacterium]
MIDIRGLTWRFDGAPRPALQEITLRIEPGELVVISGPSGCGKSTLALAMGGYLFQQYHGQAEGSVEVGGLDVRQVPIYRAAEIVGLVQQNPENQFCTLNVMDELAFALENRRYPPAEIRQQIAWALEVVGAAHLRDRALATLSGGEKQKVAIASMLVGRPQVLILDEPTSSLDPAATRAVLEAIGRLR